MELPAQMRDYGLGLEVDQSGNTQLVFARRMKQRIIQSSDNEKEFHIYSLGPCVRL